MTCQYAFLSENSFHELYQTFREAFADYELDMRYLTEETLYNRAAKNGIDFESSVGVFDNGKMVGFTMIGIDRWPNALAAFDIGTGIVKAYRGQGIARGMFDHAVPHLKRKGVEKFVLEVLQANEPAIKAYHKAGFRITRGLLCFALDLEKARFDRQARIPVEIQPIEREKISLFADHLDWLPSWENSFSSIKRIPDDVLTFGALHDNQLIGLLVYYPALNWIMSLVVRRTYRRLGVATLLVKSLADHLGSVGSSVKALNVEDSDKAMTSFLSEIGFEFYTSQFEMELDL